MENEKTFKELLEENIVLDYFTPKIKAEVILDTLLTPIIAEMLTAIGEKKGIGRMKLLAKEFPMLKRNYLKSSKDKEDFRNCNADYLMCDKSSVYFVELKTTKDSVDYNQMKNYIKYLIAHQNKKFSEIAGKDFIELLNHVYNKTENDMEELFKIIISDPIGEKPHYEKEAKKYLQKKSAVSSRKYLLTAGQILDSLKDDDLKDDDLKDDDWRDKNIKMIYIIPPACEKQLSDMIDKLKKDDDIKDYIEEKKIKTNIDDIIKDNLIFMTFQGIIDCYDKMERSEKRQEYWNWVKDILEECGLYNPKKNQ